MYMLLLPRIVTIGFAQTHPFKKGRLIGDEIKTSDDGHGRVVGPCGSIRSRCFYQRALECASGARTTAILRRSPTVADPFVDGADTGTLPQPSLDVVGRATGLAFLCALVPSATDSRCAHAPSVPVPLGRWRSAPDQRPTPRVVGRASVRLAPFRGVDGRHRFRGRLRRFQKKESQAYTAHRAALGQRTFKTGQSRWYVGYKKHTLRLWWRPHEASVLLVPLVSWVTPANLFEGALLVPSLHYCQTHWRWWPKIIVADMSYMGAPLKALCRTRWEVAVVTRLHSDAKMIAPYVTWN